MKKYYPILLISIVLLSLGYRLYDRNYKDRTQDLGDAPKSYGEPKHYFPESGPHFGAIRGDNDLFKKDTTHTFGTEDELNGQADEDAFPEIAVLRRDTASHYFPELRLGKTAYNLTVTINGAKIGDPIRAWIDFDGDGFFEENEKASSYYRGNPTEILSWPNVTNIHTQLTYLRLRTCSKHYGYDIEKPNSATETGEVEDHAIRIVNPVVDNEAEKSVVDFNQFRGINSFTAVKSLLSNLTADAHIVKITFEGKIPDIAGVDNKHDGSITGLRLGHSKENIMTAESPMIVEMALDKAVHNFSFQLFDIDAGDRIKIQGFNRGNIQPFQLSNMSEKFFFQFNSESGEIYGEGRADAGGDSKIPQSIDMGVSVIFSKHVDSIALVYSDDEPKSSGTFTLANINFRKINLPQIEISSFKYVLASGKELTMSWNVNYPENIRYYAIQRSFDGVTFETVAQVPSPSFTNKEVQLIENTLPLNIQNVFYRIKTIEIDNFVSLSEIFLVKRSKDNRDLGFRTPNNEFKSELEYEMLIDAPNGFEVTITNYKGKKIRSQVYPAMSIGQKFKLSGLESLEPGIYYFELNDGIKTYVKEGFKR